MSDERLFDPLPFSTPHRTYRYQRAKKHRTPPDVVKVQLGDVWRLFATRKGPEVHAVRLGARRLEVLCDNVVATPLTYEHGTTAAACPDCLRSGAPR